MQKPDYAQYLADMSALDGQKAEWHKQYLADMSALGAQKTERQRRYTAELAAYRLSQPTAAETQQDKQAATLARLAWLKKDAARIDDARAALTASPDPQSTLRLSALNSERKSTQKRIDAIERKIERENPALVNALTGRATLEGEVGGLLAEIMKAQAAFSADELKHLAWYQTKKARYIELVNHLTGSEP